MSKIANVVSGLFEDMKKNPMLSVIVLAYLLLVLSLQLVFPPTWDETAHNFASVPVYEFVLDGASLDYSYAKDYFFNYYTHYKFFDSLRVHPPLYKFFVLISYFIFGLGVFAIRFPTLLFGTLGVIFSYRISHMLSGKRDISLMVSALLAFSPIYLYWSIFGNMDVVVTSMSIIAFYMFLKYEKTGKPRNLYLFSLISGLSFLLKISGAFPLGVIIVYKLLKNRRELISRRFLMSYIIFAAIISPWMIVNSLVFSSTTPVNSYFSEVVFSTNAFNVPYWSGVIINSVFIFTIPGLFLILSKNIFRRDDILLLLWGVPLFLFFVFVYDLGGALPRLSLPAMFPFFYVISRGMSTQKKWLKCLVFIVVFSQSFLFVSHNYFISPAESAVDYVMQNSLEGDGFLVTEPTQQAYLMFKDRDLKFSAWWAGDKEDLESLLEGRKYKSLEGLDIEIPEISYIILDTTKRPDMLDFIKGRENIEEAKVFVYERPFTPLSDIYPLPEGSVIIFSVNNN